ncbi:hypothetical protein [Streptomyces fractus]|uniref:hypothetical protein n=1 Tax=Streptomyces fractus TaxID=641806 RepID=UPI003CF0AD73
MTVQDFGHDLGVCAEGLGFGRGQADGDLKTGARSVIAGMAGNAHGAAPERMVGFLQDQ